VTVRTSVRTDFAGGEGESQDNPTGGGGWVENAIFSWREIARCFWATGVFLGGKWHYRLYEITEVLDKKKHLISINGKKKFKRILVESEKFKLQKLPSKDFIALFSSRRRAYPVLKHNRVSEVFKGSKVHYFEYYGQRNYVLKWEFNLCH